MKKSKDVMDYSEENFAIVFAAMGVSPQRWGSGAGGIRDILSRFCVCGVKGWGKIPKDFGSAGICLWSRVPREAGAALEVSQAGGGLEHPGIVGGVPAWDELHGPSNPNCSEIP